ncbi:hypothetical protein ACX80T_08005 [Arthrobacter sp. Sr33]|uniref:hypothetical protein n=1 Tax=Arthrobacter sp. TB 23 TaxID=494419 RepID=UPI0002F8D185
MLTRVGAKHSMKPEAMPFAVLAQQPKPKVTTTLLRWPTRDQRKVVLISLGGG